MTSEVTTWLLLCLLSLGICLPFFLDSGRGKRDWFEPIYAASAYFALIFVLRGIYALTAGTDFLGEPPFDDKTMTAMNLGLMYLVPSYLLFFLAYRSKLARSLASRAPRLPSFWNETTVRFGWPLFLLLGFASLAAQIEAVGGLNTYLSDKQAALTAAGQTYFAQGAMLIQYAFVLLFTRLCATGKGGWLTFGVVAPLVLVNGFLSGSKGMFFAPVLAMIVSLHYLRRPVSLRTLAVFGSVVILVVPIFNAYRHLGTSENLVNAVQSMATDENVNGAKSLFGFLTWQFISRFHDFDSLTYIVRDTPRVMDYQYGATVLPLSYAWVPRLLWPEKPVISFGKIFSDTYYRNFFFGTGTAASPSILGDAYINFHVAGMFVISLIAGFLLRFAYELLVKRSRSAPSVFIYANLFLFMFVFWESNIAGFVADLLARLVVLLGVVFAFGPKWKGAPEGDARGLP